jgi:hypothetical protein
MTYLTYPIGCEVLDANAVLRKHYVTIGINVGDAPDDFSILNRGVIDKA